MLLGLICSAYVEAAAIAGIAATLNMMVGAPLITVVGGYIITALAIVSIFVTFAKTYEMILAYTDFMATGDLDAAYEVFRIAYDMGKAALMFAIMAKLEAALRKSGSGGGNSGSSGGNKPSVPENAKNVAEQIKANNGTPPKGYKGGKTYKNNPIVEGAQKLPEGVNYREYDINPYVKGQNRGAERIVLGDDGSVWYTSDHYYTFIQIE